MSQKARADTLEHTIPIEDAACAQAVFGPLHRHLALIQEAFRRPGERGAAAHIISVDARGNDVVLRGAEGQKLIFAVPSASCRRW